MNRSKEFRKNVKKYINENDSYNEADKEELCKSADTEDLLKYNIFTKYHLQ
jgi:hypothetical protein